MPTREADIKKIERQRETSSSLATEAGGLESSATTLQDNVMKAVRNDRAKRGISTLAKDVGTTSGQLVSDPIGIKERAGDIVDPTSVDFATSRQRAQNLATLGTQATALKQQEGSLTEAIQAEANSLLARAKQKQVEAQQEAQRAQDALEMLKFKSAEEQTAFENELSLKKFNASQADKDKEGTPEESADFSARYRTYLSALEETEGADVESFKADVIELGIAIREGSMTVDEAMQQLALVHPISIDPAAGSAEARNKFKGEAKSSGSVFNSPQLPIRGELV